MANGIVKYSKLLNDRGFPLKYKAYSQKLSLRRLRYNNGNKDLKKYNFRERCYCDSDQFLTIMSNELALKINLIDLRCFQSFYIYSFLTFYKRCTLPENGGRSGQNTSFSHYKIQVQFHVEIEVLVLQKKSSAQFGYEILPIKCGIFMTDRGLICVELHQAYTFHFTKPSYNLYAVPLEPK